MKKLLAVLAVAILVLSIRAFAQVTVSQDCSTAGVTEFGNIVVNGTQAFYQSVLAQSNADLIQKAQTDAVIQSSETEDQIQIATAQAGLNAIANCIANQ